MREMNWKAGLALACILVGGSAGAYAQSTTQGAIAGTVFDATDAAVPNAKILIQDEGTNAEITLTSSASGNFRAPQLTPGIYTVTITAGGFAAVKTASVVVTVNNVTELNPHLVAGSEGTTVQVTADTPAINFDSAVFGGNLDNKEIENIPINNRRWSSLALTTPGVTNDASGFGLLSFRAIASVLNNVQIDGADDNQAFFSEERGRTRAGYSTSQAMVREFQVNTGVYSAEFGRAVGGVINSVTKTGSNTLHGEAYFYRRDDQFGAYNAFTTLGKFNSAGQFQQTPFRPKDKRNQYGFEVGGPILKDKLFFVYAFDVFDRQFPGIAKASSPLLFFATADTALPGGYACNAVTGAVTKTTAITTISVPDAGACLIGARTKSTYGSGALAYNNGLQALNTDLGSVPRYGHQNINTPKINWQINPKHNVSFLYHRLRWDSPGGVQTQSSVSDAVDSFGTDFVKLDYGLMKFDSLLTSRIANEFRYQYSRELNDQGQQPYSAYTNANFLNGATGNVAGYNIFSATAGFLAGQQTYSNRVAYPDERKWQIADTASLTYGKHNMRVGFDIVHNNDVQNQLFQAQGTFSYSTSIANYLSDLLVPAGSCDTTLGTTGALPCYNSYVQGYGPAAFTLNTVDYGFFFQDDWKLTPRLTINLGARYDYEAMPPPFANLITIAQTNNHPSDKNNLAPRLGFAFDPIGKGKTVVRGGFGIYYGRIPNSVILGTLQNTGSINSQTTVSYTPGTAGQPTIRNQVASGGAAPASIYYFDPHFQNPANYQMDLAVQHDLGKSNVVSIAYLGALGRQLPNYINTNIDPTKAYSLTYNIVPNAVGSCGPTACGNITTKVYGGRAQTNAGGTLSNVYNGANITPNTTYAGITDVLSNINSSYHAVSIDVTNRTYHWVTFDANYTFAHALDFSQLQTTGTTTNNWIDPFGDQTANYGNSNLDVRQRAVGWANLQIPGVADNKSVVSYLANGWSIKPLVQVQTGLPYSATVSGSTPQQCYSIGCLATSAATTSGLLGTGVSYIPQIGRNTFRYPRSINMDTRVQKDFKLHENYSLQLIAEAFNLANHQNVTSIAGGAYALAVANKNTGTQAPTATLTPTTNFQQVTNTNSTYAFAPRQFQFALRLQF